MSGKGLILSNRENVREIFAKCESFGTGKTREEIDHEALSLFVL